MAIAQPIFSSATGSHRTFNDLPPELLHVILRVVQDRYALKCVASLSRYLRTVALGYVFSTAASVKDSASFGHFARFLHQYPHIAASIEHLVLNGQARDAAYALSDDLLASMVKHMPNLKTLRFAAVHFQSHLGPRNETCPCPSPRRPFKLQELWLGWDHSEQSTLSSIFRVLSIFEVDDLDASLAGWKFDPAVPFDATCLHRPLRVTSLEVGCSPDSPSYTTAAINAFCGSLESGSLKRLAVTYDSPETVSAVGRLLTRVGGDVEELRIRTAFPKDERQEEEHIWTDPLESIPVDASHIPSCTNLKHFTFSIRHTLQPSALIKPVHIDLILQLPPLLESLTVVINKLSGDAIRDESPLGLGLLEATLLLPRFPRLRHVQLRVQSIRATGMLQVFYWSKCHALILGEMPNLTAAGMLEVSR